MALSRHPSVRNNWDDIWRHKRLWRKVGNLQNAITVVDSRLSAVTDLTPCTWQIVAVSMVSVTTGLAVVVYVSPGPVRKAILGNSVTRPPRTVARAGCPSTATRTLSAASTTQQGQSFWHIQSSGHMVVVQAHSSCEAASTVIVYVSLRIWCTGLFE